MFSELYRADEVEKFTASTGKRKFEIKFCLIKTRTLLNNDMLNVKVVQHYTCYSFVQYIEKID